MEEGAEYVFDFLDPNEPGGLFIVLDPPDQGRILDTLARSILRPPEDESEHDTESLLALACIVAFHGVIRLDPEKMKVRLYPVIHMVLRSLMLAPRFPVIFHRRRNSFRCANSSFTSVETRSTGHYVSQSSYILYC
ncbi:hypothetical protein SISSUDRAFT_1052186 [Sistotremastrum suecicum HHB10207 ss-3]|uniref:Uncharacterized protein n=1 Tax=Sistotremastrum suecicum HHB10207 ss-3 TaxID=1314776 RepID=A0A166A3U0_9AGAM|nr:hypothetical protein SISSUDRAFT_1052186 [Sistotremastrum suecicum HHB10207 ss-3]